MSTVSAAPPVDQHGTALDTLRAALRASNLANSQVQALLMILTGLSTSSEVLADIDGPTAPRSVRVDIANRCTVAEHAVAQYRGALASLDVSDAFVATLTPGAPPSPASGVLRRDLGPVWA